MPIVEIKILKGRDTAAIERLIREVTDAVERSIGARRDTIRVLVHEIAGKHWGAGGKVKATPDESET